jgi:hypothetical protein
VDGDERQSARNDLNDRQSDGTLEWDATTLVVVEVAAGDACGLGYTYADTATALLIRHKLAAVVCGRSTLD